VAVVVGTGAGAVSPGLWAAAWVAVSAINANNVDVWIARMVTSELKPRSEAAYGIAGRLVNSSMSGVTECRRRGNISMAARSGPRQGRLHQREMHTMVGFADGFLAPSHRR